MPVPGTMKRAPKELLIVWVLATTLPLPSATVRCVVCEPCAGETPGPQASARRRSMRERRSVA